MPVRARVESRTDSRFRNTPVLLLFVSPLVLALSSGLAAQDTGAGSGIRSRSIGRKDLGSQNCARGNAFVLRRSERLLHRARRCRIDPARPSAVDQRSESRFQQKVEQTAAAIKSAGKYEEVRIRVDPNRTASASASSSNRRCTMESFCFPVQSNFPTRA
jgi:hypothetical protein